MAKKPAKAAKPHTPAKKKPAQDITRPDDADRDPAPNTAVTWIGVDDDPQPSTPQPNPEAVKAYHDASRGRK